MAPSAVTSASRAMSRIVFVRLDFRARENALDRVGHVGVGDGPQRSHVVGGQVDREVCATRAFIFLTACSSTLRT